MTSLPPDVNFVPVVYDDLPGWRDEDHRTAFVAFCVSAKRLIELSDSGTGYLGTPPSEDLLFAAKQAVCSEPDSRKNPRQFFENHFTPHQVRHDGRRLLTGYYEPVLEGARLPDKKYCWPLLNRPKDLVNLVAESERGQKGDSLTHGRKAGDDIVPYATRREIDEGALDTQQLAFLWLKDPVDRFFLHVQGSGVVALPDGSETRVTYDGKNGHPYTSVGRYVIDQGWFPEAEMSLDRLKDWLCAHPDQAREAMWQNKSYIFFRELTADEPATALGVMEIPLTKDRSLAVDTAFHEIGTPIYVTAPDLTHIDTTHGLRRLMIAQDVGSAIRGPERGDIFYGTGDEAGTLAGNTIHPGTFYVLKPNARGAGT
jgi:peptidoglycan lytic transglycosylase A